MSKNEANDSQDKPEPTQAEITQEYQHMTNPGRRVAVAIGQKSLREMMGLSLVDDSNLAAQIRRAIGEYAIHRKEDPTFPQQVEAARERFDKERELTQAAFGQGLMSPAEPNAPDEPEEQLPETD